MTPIRSILRSMLNDKNTLDIVSLNNYPYYDWMYGLLSNRYHMYLGDKLPYKWDENILAKPPNMIYDITPDLPLSLEADLILSHNRLEQYDLGKILSNFWHIPMCLVHQLAPRDMKYNNQWQFIASRKGDSNIFLSHYIQEQWDIPGYVINPGVPVMPNNVNKQKKEVSHIWCGPEEQKFIHKNIGNISFIKNGDFSSCMILVNSTTQFYPIHVLIAMAHGCCVITEKIPELEDLIEHDDTGLIYKDVPDLNKILASYKDKPSKCQEMGQRARERILKRFPVKEFINRMTFAIKNSAEITYVR